NARRLHDELVRFRRGSYQYKAVPDDRTHLGVILDEVGPNLSVDATGDRVDLYGYTSMAVAALQTQAREIEALKNEVETLRQELDADGVASRPRRIKRTK